MRISGGNPAAQLTYKWSLSAGTLISGQGTSSIKVDATKFAEYSVTATVEIGGLEPECKKMESISQTICDPPPPSYRFFDSYGDISLSKEKSLLNRFALRLKADPSARGYIVFYGSSRRRAQRARRYLIAKRKIETARIMIAKGGDLEGSGIQLYLVPPGGLPPWIDSPPDNSLQPTRY